MADGRHFENRYIAISQWKKLSDFNEIWYTTSDIEPDWKVEIFEFEMATAAILKIAFLAITQ